MVKTFDNSSQEQFQNCIVSCYPREVSSDSVIHHRNVHRIHKVMDRGVKLP